MGDEANIDMGKEMAQDFIARERIDYQPFVALSDLYLVRKTVPISYDSFLDTLEKTAPALRQEVVESVAELSGKKGFNADNFALGFAEGVAAVWDRIRDKV